MSQSRRMSLIEQVASVAVGFVVALVIQLTLLPAMGVESTLGQDFAIVGVFTVASILRGYFMRRLFNWIHFRQGLILIPNVCRHRIPDNGPAPFQAGYYAAGGSCAPTNQNPPPRPPAKK